MEDAQALTKAITQAPIEATKAVATWVMAVAGAKAGSGQGSMEINIGPKLDRPSFKQQSFGWSARGKFTELLNFLDRGKQYYHDIQHK